MKDSRSFMTDEEKKFREKIYSKTKRYNKVFWNGAIALMICMIPFAIVVSVIAVQFPGLELMIFLISPVAMFIPLGIYYEKYFFPLGKEINKLQEKCINKYMSSC